MVHAGYFARLMAVAIERGHTRGVHHGHAVGIVHSAPCSIGGLNSTRYFQAKMSDVLNGYIDMICLV